MTPLTIRKDLDAIRCQEPGCTCNPGEGVAIVPVCHPDAPLEAFYRHGELSLACVECEQPVVNVAVAG